MTEKKPHPVWLLWSVNVTVVNCQIRYLFVALIKIKLLQSLPLLLEFDHTIRVIKTRNSSYRGKFWSREKKFSSSERGFRVIRVRVNRVKLTEKLGQIQGNWYSVRVSGGVRVIRVRVTGVLLYFSRCCPTLMLILALWLLKTRRFTHVTKFAVILPSDVACEQTPRLGKTKRNWSRREKWPSGGWGWEKAAFFPSPHSATSLRQPISFRFSQPRSLFTRFKWC